MEHVVSLKCLVCGKRYGIDEIDYVCPDHGDEGITDVEYDYGLIGGRIKKEDLLLSTEYSLWRYKPLLPVAPEAEVPPLSVGWTPLYRSPRMASELGVKEVWVKDDGRMPTASLKDRASAVAVVKAREKGAAIMTTASTGNAAAALSGLCASVNQANVIFVPESAPPAKIAQLVAFGSTVLLVRGTYDHAFELCMKAAKAYGWYNRNTGYNPYMSEGKKTVAYEICEQMGWDVPDNIVVSVGDGCIIGGIHKGLKDLYALGWIARIPRLIGVQAEGSDYMCQAWEKDEDVLKKEPISPRTIADSISAGLPRDRIKAMAAVKETDGAYIRVSDDEILEAIPALAQATGVFAEPAGAASYAGLIKAVEKKIVSRNDATVIIATGSGLKDISSAMKSTERQGRTPFRVEPDLEEVKRIMGEMRSSSI